MKIIIKFVLPRRVGWLWSLDRYPGLLGNTPAVVSGSPDLLFAEHDLVTIFRSGRRERE